MTSLRGHFVATWLWVLSPLHCWGLPTGGTVGMDPNTETLCIPGAVIAGEASQNPNRMKLDQDWPEIPLKECQNRNHRGPPPADTDQVSVAVAPQGSWVQEEPTLSIVRSGNGD